MKEFSVYCLKILSSDAEKTSDLKTLPGQELNRSVMTQSFGHEPVRAATCNKVARHGLSSSYQMLGSINLRLGEYTASR